MKLKCFAPLLSKSQVATLLGFLSFMLLNMPGASLQAAEPAAKKVAIDPLDWPSWRGPEQNGISREKNLVSEWDPKGGEGSNLLWKNEELGGRSTPIVMNGKLYTVVRDQPATKREGEKLICVDAATGKKLWENRFNVYLSDVPDTRVGWAACAGDPATGNVYVQGVCGYFACVDGETGKTVWSRSLHEEFGFLSTYGGRTNTPVVFENLVLPSAVTISWDTLAKPAHRFMAFDKKSGELVWFAGTRLAPYDTTYSTPVISVIGGQMEMVFGSGDGAIWALQPRTGKQIWHYDFSRRGLNISPIIDKNIVYMGHSEENMSGADMGNMIAFDALSPGDLTGKQKWSNVEMAIGKASPLLVDGRLYVIDDGAKFRVLNAETGEELQKLALGTVQRSSPVYADGKIYVCEGNGRWYVLKPTEDGVEVIHKLRLKGLSDGSPIVSHGRIYLPLSDAMYCIGEAGQKPSADPIPKPEAEAPVSQDKAVAQVQVVPCEVILQPGAKQTFTVRTFNSYGQLLQEKVTDAKFTLKGPGEIAEDGTYTAGGTNHDAAWITATVGEVKGEARLRIVPPLPWKWTFDDLKDMPITWAGGRVRYVVREGENGNKYAAKLDNIPTKPGQFTKLGTRSQCWFGPDTLSNYTIQADCSAQEKGGKMPEIGLINQRYTLTLLGNAQQLQISSWVSQPERMGKSVAFQWKPDTWYTMKMTTEAKDGKVTVRGKVWPRDSEEPKEWSIEATDEAPSFTGSPGLFGSTPDSEFYLDNITVTSNDAAPAVSASK